jgi:hypothetical protein
MMKSSLSAFVLLISSLTVFILQIDAVTEYDKSSENNIQANWLGDSHRHRIELFKKWLGNKPVGNTNGERSASPYDALHPTHQFKGACYSRLLSLEMFFYFLLKFYVHQNCYDYCRETSLERLM